MKKNYMAGVAILLGKKLGEEFRTTISPNTRWRITEDGLECRELNGRKKSWYGADSTYLYQLLTGKEGLIDDE